MEKLHQAWFSPHSNYLSQVPRSSWLYVTFLFGLPLQFAAQSEKKLKLLSFFMIELSLVEYEMRKFCLSMLAAAAIYTAQCTMNGFKSWNKCCKLHTKYFFMTLMILIKKYFINLLQVSKDLLLSNWFKWKLRWICYICVWQSALPTACLS